MDKNEKILFSNEIAELLDISEDELHEKIDNYAVFISDYQHFHKAVEAVEEDQKQYDHIHDKAKRLALITTYFTASWTDFERGYYADICNYIQSKYTGEEDANNSARTTH